VSRRVVLPALAVGEILLPQIPPATPLLAAPVVRLWYPTLQPLAAPAPLSEVGAPFPVLVYFPGWPGTQIDNYALIRELAGHGFAVASVQYPARLPGMSEASYRQLVDLLSRPMDYSSDEAHRETLRQAAERVQTRARDAASVLDLLTGINAGKQPGQFAGRLDPERAGIVGFSLGGAVAAEASHVDRRFRAVVNMDGRHWGQALKSGVQPPYLFIGAELVIPTDADLKATDPDRRFNAILDRIDYAQLSGNLSKNGGIHATIFGAEHANFTDEPPRMSLRRLLRGGSISARRGVEIVNAYVLAFFGKHLMGEASPLLAANSELYPEVRVEVYAAQSESPN
jgi:dienelactone hydrolase